MLKLFIGMISSLLPATIGVQFQNNRFDYVWPIALLRWYAVVFFQILQVAVFKLFLVTLDCQVSASKLGHGTVHSLSPTILISVLRYTSSLPHPSVYLQYFPGSGQFYNLEFPTVCECIDLTTAELGVALIVFCPDYLAMRMSNKSTGQVNVLI